MPALKKPSTFTSREFNQDTARAKREAANGPVFITDRGKPALVLLNHADYQRLLAPEPSVAELFADSEAAEIELIIPPRVIEQPRPLDLSD